MSNEPHLREMHVSDKYGTKFVNKTEELQGKAQKYTKHDGDNKGPAGGFDDTSIPDAPPGSTIRITFHRAEDLPFSDLHTFSSDPYIHATFKTSLPKRHKQDPDIFLRTPTIHRRTNPQWETQWVIAHVPASGFFLKCRIYDEDPANHDDRLGNVHVHVNNIGSGWKDIVKQPYVLKKRMGSKRAYTFRGAAVLLKKSLKMSGRLFVSVENLGRSPGESGGRCYTVAPLTWVRHQSPLIGRIAGTKAREETKDGKKGIERYNFQAVQIQLRGPVPAPMYHRYVEFRPFIASMFTDVSLRGRILNRALHHQHARIYNYDKSTVYGVYEKSCVELTKRFLELVHYDQGGRIYTYVLSLDGLWRFTETGKEFGIDMLSKHTMHSDVSIYIAFSGEFFVRRLKHPRSAPRREKSSASHISDLINEIAPPSADPENQDGHNGEHSHSDIPKDPKYYELIIDNDSGTYRPKGELLPLLKEYIAMNLPGLKVATLDCQKDEEKMKKLKGEQRERKKHSGKQITYMQNSSMSSLSSSDEEKLDARASGQEPQHAYEWKAAKMRAHRKEGEDAAQAPADSNPPQSSDHPNPLDATCNDDSGDLPPSLSSGGDLRNQHLKAEHTSAKIDGQRNDSTYANEGLPTLLKKDANGHIAQPQESLKGGSNRYMRFIHRAQDR